MAFVCYLPFVFCYLRTRIPSLYYTPSVDISSPIAALDVGMRRTGIAIADPRVGFALPRDTLQHTSEEALVEQVRAFCTQEGVTELVIGLPLLLSGEEGSQSRFVRGVVSRLEAFGLICSLLDERYSTPVNSASDGDAAAACSLLETFLSRRKGC